jgi:hypothetical protein
MNNKTIVFAENCFILTLKATNLLAACSLYNFPAVNADATVVYQLANRT